MLIVPTTDGEAIEQFSLRVAEAWKIGRKKIDDGALLVIAKNDRRLRIEVGYGLEGALTDATTKRIIDEDITPKFKTRRFRRWRLGGRRPDGPGRRGREIAGAGAAALARSPACLNAIDPFNPFVLAFVFIVGGALRAALGRLVGSAATGGFVGVLAWLLVGSLGVAAVVGVLAFLISAFIDLMPSGGSRGTRGGWSGGSSSDWGSSSSSGSSSERLQWRRRQLWRRRRIGELVA